MSLPTKLTGLSSREAIVDALHRCILGIDTNDLDLFSSAFNADSTMTLNDIVWNGLKSVVTGCYDLLAKLDTTHHVSNMRINISSDKTRVASMTAHVIANHFRRGDGLREGGDAPRLLVGALYDIQLVQMGDGGGEEVWKIKEFHIETIWREGDASVMQD